MAQYGFAYGQGRCTGCRTCSVACKSWHGLPPGPLKYLRVYEYESGSFPEVRLHFQWVPCYHCEEPACLATCPTGAIYRENDFGAVVIDSAKCDGCRLCYEACPYGAPVFESDAADARAQKCDMCITRLREGESPICVAACPTRALDFGPLKALAGRYGDRKDLEGLPDSRATLPAVVFQPAPPKKKLVPYDSQRALQLMMRRDPLPPVFSTSEDVTGIPPGLAGRRELIIKHTSAEDLMRRTRNDEG